MLCNTVQVVRMLLDKAQCKAENVAAIGISNQRETTVAWNRTTGRPVCDAIVWQCNRAEAVCGNFTGEQKQQICDTTGIPLSPYFPAAKMRWILQNVPEAKKEAKAQNLCLGTVDSYLLFRMTGGKSFATDYSNASRTQLLNLHTLFWDEDILSMFGIPAACLPEVRMSDSLFGSTTLDGTFPAPVPIHAMLGDSHAALFGHGCHTPGGVKTTYGTGSSIMMNIGEHFLQSKNGLVTSLAWGWEGKVSYVFEGNLNYTGAVVTWLKEIGLISSASETEALARSANPQDTTYLVPAFSGLGAPYWNSDAKAAFWGMTRSTGRNEIVKAALDCTAYQITDILKAMQSDCRQKISRLCVDGGPTRNGYLMQMQSDISEAEVFVPDAEELSGMGAAYMAGLSSGIYPTDIFKNLHYTAFLPAMEPQLHEEKYSGWKDAVKNVIR